MQDSDEQNFVLMEAFSLVVASDWLSLRTLAQLCAVNKEMDAIVSQSTIWRLYLSRNSVLQLGQDYDGCPISTFRYNWKALHIPPPIIMHRLRIPPRMHGRRYDAFSYEPHEKDLAAKELNLVLPSDRDSQNHFILPRIQTMRFNEETGVLEDLFYSKKDPMKKTFVVPHPLDILLAPDAFVGPLHGGAVGGYGTIKRFRVIPQRTPIWVKRELPIYCPVSDVWFHSYQEMIDYCVLFDHQKRMVTLQIKEDVEDWEKLTAKTQVRAYLANNTKMNMFDIYDRRCIDLHSNMFQMYRYWLIILLVICITPLERMFANYYKITDFEEALLATRTISYVFTFLFIIMPILRWWKINVTHAGGMRGLKSKIAYILPTARSKYSKLPQCDSVG